MKKYYKIIDVNDNGIFKTLFHSVTIKNRNLPKNKWLKAKNKLVSEGIHGKKYISGFHVIPTLEECILYSKKFKIKNNRRIISLYCKSIRSKKHSNSNVKLANKIFIPFNCEIYKLL